MAGASKPDFVSTQQQRIAELAKQSPQMGFTHYWGLSRRDFWVVKQKTARSRPGRAVMRITDWCRKNLHLAVGVQWHKLRQKLLGHFAYYGVTGNLPALRQFRHAVMRVWFKWLARRQRKGYFARDVFNRLLQRFPLPPATVVHSVYRRAANP